MKNLLLLFIIFAFVSCKKSERYGPLNLKNGQEVELLVSHRYGADNDQLLKLPGNVDAGASLSGFDQREPGYTYRVKATFKYNENPPQDASSYYFFFEKINSKEQYKGNESFTVQLITNYLVGGPNIRLSKTGTEYYMIPGKLQLTYANSTIQNELEEIWLNAQEIRTNWQNGQRPKWKAIKATVVHDPQQFGKAYLVQQIQFIN
ncbi:hypothetical protein [Pedobacter alluvionis]|uniref:DUF4377 domain-containing protein n=1 Tax=Pedobacter alluvionis TaxID=475253 RepID=A0A497XU63_9SPHI|nr:hypothetical protein [Pedobacter alluvionis]RLJ72014.1 hypothetical protein BCL90_4841 [Pedobacter alluvionis]TFB28788.1 hypothetical protein E3V97_21955 [Pedobacter alluvionis]